jgi:hypothetical protein
MYSLFNLTERKIMKKIIHTSVLVTCLFFGLVNITFASITVINQSKFPASISYSVCKPHGGVCSGSWPVINAKETGNNQIEISASSKDKFEILTAVEKDSNNNVVAKMDQACSLPTGTEIVYLYDAGTSHIICLYQTTR